MKNAVLALVLLASLFIGSAFADDKTDVMKGCASMPCCQHCCCCQK